VQLMKISKRKALMFTNILIRCRPAAAAMADADEAAAAEHGDWGSGRIAAALELVVADLAKLHSLLPELNLLDKCAPPGPQAFIF